jgi:hypothetical protein
MMCNHSVFRSHAILTIHVESRLSPSGSVHAASPGSSPLPSPRTEAKIASESSLPSELRLGKMHLVDLAGSERLAMSHAEGETLVETQNINLSLTALGNRATAALQLQLLIFTTVCTSQAMFSLRYQKIHRFLPIMAVRSLSEDQIGHRRLVVRAKNYLQSRRCHTETLSSLIYSRIR